MEEDEEARPTGRPPFVPTDEERRQVELEAGYGLRQEDIACIIGLTPKTLRKHFAKELELGKAKASSAVGKSLYRQATEGNTAAAIFWAKSQMGWREKQEPEGEPDTTIRIVRVPMNG